MKPTKLFLALTVAALLGARGHLGAFALLSVLDGVGAVGQYLYLLRELLGLLGRFLRGGLLVALR